ncbi:hypothetical protein CWI36_2396p0010 [Hamiltosporidium magnivora]|uniref:Uncharacterized protein n=1 Tax=Hamiltosporidium magnivora TaxID=148818 RepID=A0A4Q9KVT2_9MICR|nr:hypothetical protein CWI36_2396p0010 [Hamiltosporidium magnivora]
MKILNERNRFRQKKFYVQIIPNRTLGVLETAFIIIYLRSKVYFDEHRSYPSILRENHYVSYYVNYSTDFESESGIMYISEKLKELHENALECEKLLRELECKSKIVTQYVETSRKTENNKN